LKKRKKKKKKLDQLHENLDELKAFMKSNSQQAPGLQDE
jgi:hypothetical protein